MDFYSMSNRPQTIPMPETSKFEAEYMEDVDPKTGKVFLKKVGEINVYEKIQASKESNLLENILDRYKNVVDEGTIFKIGKDIVDYTQLPDNAIEAQSILARAKAEFEVAPEELRSKFNNSFYEYLAGASNGKLAEYLASKQPKKEDVVVEQPVVQPQQQNYVNEERINYGQ